LIFQNRNTNIETHYLGWDQPFLWSIVSWLSEKPLKSPYDFRGILLVLPSKRAGRRLLELLAGKSEESGNILIPPQIILVHDLGSLLSNKKNISPSERNLIWNEVLSSHSTLLKEFYSTSDDSVTKHLSPQLVQYLDRLRTQLGSYLIRPQEIISNPVYDASENQVRQWEVIGKLFSAFEDTLDRLSLTDEVHSSARLLNQDSNTITEEYSEIILLGCTNLTPLQKRSLQNLNAEQLSIVLFAPEVHEKGFTHIGELVPEYWSKISSERLSPEVLLFADSPIELSEKLADASEKASQEKVPLSHITLGMLEPDLIAPTMYALERKGLSGSAPGTRHAKDSLLGSWLLSISQIWAYGDEATAHFLKHPLTTILLNRKRKSEAEAFSKGCISRAADILFIETLHSSLSTLEKLPPKVQNDLLFVKEYLLENNLSKKSGKQTLAEFCASMQALLLHLFDEDESKNNFKDVPGTEINEILTILESYASFSEIFTSPITSKDFYFLLKDRLFKTELPPIEDEGVELLGWFELLFDDSSVKIISGCNEEYLPEKLALDPLLPNPLRQTLALETNEYLHARDNYQMTCILESTPQVTLIASRKSSQGERLKLSRLVIPQDDDLFCEVLNQYYLVTKSTTSNAHKSELPQSFIPPSTPYKNFPLRHLSASAIKKYLRCPYEFYLTTILRAQHYDFFAREISPPMLGTLIHECSKYVGEYTRNLTTGSENEIRNAIHEFITRETRSRFGLHPSVSITLQIENIKRKLSLFSKWAQETSQDGWRNIACESKLASEASITLSNNEQIPFTGIIDRIDFHKGTNTLRIIDIKTSDTPYTFKECLKKDTWIDPQLPLYAYFTSQFLHTLNYQFDSSPQIELALISLNKTSDISVTTHPYSPDDGEESKKIACEVGEKILHAEFWPPQNLNPVLERKIFGSSLFTATEEESTEEITI
jgi:ATP-dependent helicase/nuclease subunit B